MLVSTFAQPASAFAQPASTFAQPASAFAQPAFGFHATSIEFRLRKLIENKKIKVSAEIFTSIGEIL
jgi:hypothetical protein